MTIDVDYEMREILQKIAREERLKQEKEEGVNTIKKEEIEA